MVVRRLNYNRSKSVYGQSNKKSPAQLKASVKALEDFRKEDMKPEAVVNLHGVTKELSIDSDHMKIIISRAIGERLKTHIIEDSEDSEDCFDELLSWSTVIEKLLDQIQELKRQQQSIIIVKSKEAEAGAEAEPESESEPKSEFESESFLLYSPDGIPLKLLSSTLDKWKRLYKKVCKNEKDYVISVDAFMLTLLKTYVAQKEGLEKVLDPGPIVKSNYRPKSRPGTKHKNPKIGPLFSELADSPSRSS